MNDSGVVIGEVEGVFGTTVTTLHDTAFVDENGKFTFLRVPGSQDTFFTGINDSGEIVGDYVVLENPNASPSNYIYTFYGFTYENGSYTLFDGPGGIPAVPVGIDNRGDILAISGTPEPSSLSLILIAVCLAGARLLGRRSGKPA